MASYSDNDVFLSIGGTDVSAYLRGDVTLSPSTAATDVTTGAGKDHVERNIGMVSHSISFTLALDTADHPTVLPLLSGLVKREIIYGPMGNGAGNPKHTQTFVLTGTPLSGGLMKESVFQFAVSGESDGAPTDDLTNGDTW